MRIDCHTHTSRHSACSALGARELCRTALARKLDAVALTEHHYFWARQDVEILQREFPELKLYRGMEVSLAEGYDVVCLAAVDALRVPVYPTLAAFLETVADLRESLFLFAAHPFRFDRDYGSPLKAVLSAMDGIEMNSLNILKAAPVRALDRYIQADLPLYEKARADFGLIPLYNSDAHAPAAVGTIATYVDSQTIPANERELIALLKRAATRETQDLAVLAKALAPARRFPWF